ncbi:MAG: hypothetical protein DMH00_10215 [Acidobacteria bacterium]|nr:MAG: hypothetical protein DMH00_10215 [Acidobacteriota bacterium]
MTGGRDDLANLGTLHGHRDGAVSHAGTRRPFRGLPGVELRRGALVVGQLRYSCRQCALFRPFGAGPRGSAPHLPLLIRWAGAAYLIFLGLRTFLGKGEAFAEFPAPAVNTGLGRRLLLRGVVLQAVNPKSLIFFTALLPQFIDPKGPVGWQVLILGVSSVVVEFFVLCGYGLFAGRAAGLAKEPRYARLTNRLAGACLILAATGVALAGK